MKIRCLIDNAVQQGSRLWGEHGLAFVIESPEGRLLFDTGASGAVLLHNMREIELAAGSLTAIALSHAHYDHSGGLPALLELHPGLPLYANADVMRERFSRRDAPAAPTSIGLTVSPVSLGRLADLRLSAAPQEILPGVWTSGEITGRSEPEGRSPRHVIAEGNGWNADPYRDDMALIFEVPQGLVLVCGCCHAGLLNTLRHVERTFGRRPKAVIGGTHLVGTDGNHLHHLIETLRQGDPPALFLNHCTGQAAYVSLAQALGKKVAACPAGTVLEF